MADRWIAERRKNAWVGCHWLLCMPNLGPFSLQVSRARSERCSSLLLSRVLMSLSAEKSRSRANQQASLIKSGCWLAPGPNRSTVSTMRVLRSWDAAAGAYGAEKRGTEKD
jgi:hypothetical protein